MKTNINKNVVKSGAFALALGAGLSGAAQAQPAPQVYLNGSPLRLEVAPIQQNGRTLVPMRDIFEALGATVSYNSLSQAIAAQKGNTTVRMALGTANASVNNLPVKLDAPAQAYYGRTMVPLRFVSEALGADVSFNAGTRIVSINASGVAAGGVGNGGTQVGGIRQISIPAQSVIPVRLDRSISSATATVNQRISATVVSERPGDSEFPAGTVLRGTVVEVVKRSGNNPGVLDLRFRNATLPDGTRVPLSGDVVSMDSDTVENQNGRFVAKGNARSNSDSLKVIGIGAGAGFLVGRLLKKDGALPAIIGAAGGYLFDRNKSKVSDAKIAAGTRIGIRLRNSVTYRDTTGYYDERSNYVKL